MQDLREDAGQPTRGNTRTACYAWQHQRTARGVGLPVRPILLGMQSTATPATVRLRLRCLRLADDMPEMYAPASNPPGKPAMPAGAPSTDVGLVRAGELCNTTNQGAELRAPIKPVEHESGAGRTGGVTLMTYDTGQSTRARSASLTVSKLTRPLEAEPVPEWNGRQR
jgi:hypothetical protein